VTHNGHAMLKFFSGAFEGGGPCQPVVLAFPYAHFHAAFYQSSLSVHVLRLLLTPWQRIQVTYLPVYHPSAEEAADAALYAANVCRVMAEAAGVQLSSYGARELRAEMKSGGARPARAASKGDAG